MKKARVVAGLILVGLSLALSITVDGFPIFKVERAEASVEFYVYLAGNYGDWWSPSGKHGDPNEMNCRDVASLYAIFDISKAPFVPDPLRNHIGYRSLHRTECKGFIRPEEWIVTVEGYLYKNWDYTSPNGFITTVCGVVNYGQCPYTGDMVLHRYVGTSDGVWQAATKSYLHNTVTEQQWNTYDSLPGSSPEEEQLTKPCKPGGIEMTSEGPSPSRTGLYGYVMSLGGLDVLQGANGANPSDSEAAANYGVNLENDIPAGQEGQGQLKVTILVTSQTGNWNTIRIGYAAGDGEDPDLSVDTSNAPVDLGGGKWRLDGANASPWPTGSQAGYFTIRSNYHFQTGPGFTITYHITKVEWVRCTPTCTSYVLWTDGS